MSFHGLLGETWLANRRRDEVTRSDYTEQSSGRASGRNQVQPPSAPPLSLRGRCRAVLTTGPAAYRRADGIAVIPLALLGP